MYSMQRTIPQIHLSSENERFASRHPRKSSILLFWAPKSTQNDDLGSKIHDFESKNQENIFFDFLFSMWVGPRSSVWISLGSNRREGGPPIYRVVLRPCISELREPILIIFEVLKSRWVEFGTWLFFMGFGSAGSVDLERFTKTHWFREIKFRGISAFL